MNKALQYNREAWLRKAYALLRRKLIKECPEHVVISWSFPAKGGASATRRRVGECHYKGGSADGAIEGDRVVLISPVLQEPSDLIETLLHEMVHVALPMGCGHRKQFSRLATRVGFMKPWTSTPPTPELSKRIAKEILPALPKWPGGHLIIHATQKNRQLKATCDCGRIIRGSAKLFEQGSILCGICDSEFTQE